MSQRIAPELLQSAMPARFTADEFLRMAEVGAFDDMKVELSHGELVRMTPPHSPHAAMQAQLIVRLHTATGEVAGLRGDVGVKLSVDTVRAFDAALVDADATEGVLSPLQVRLAIEVADTSLEQDLGVKARDYAEAGIPLYWVVDVNARATHVMSNPQPGSYADRQVVRFGEPLTLPDGLGEVILV